jgi:hypothetical protein
MSSPRDEVWGFQQQQLVVGTSAGFGLLITPLPGEVSSQVKYASGGSIEIFNCPVGTTAPGTSLVAGKGYLLGTAEVLNITGPAQYYLVATGSTATAFCLKGLGANFGG